MDEVKYERARKQVEIEKGWYSHLIVYLVINILLQFFYSGAFDDGYITGHFPWWARLTTPFFWGLGIIGHGLYAFMRLRWKNPFKKWEERKIKEYMKQDAQEYHEVFKHKKNS